MLPDRVSNPGPLTYESGAVPIALRGPALAQDTRYKVYTGYHGTSEIGHGLCVGTVDNPLAKAPGLSLRTSAQTMLCLSLNLNCTHRQVQSTLVISKLKGPSETLRDIRTSTYQIFRIEENTNRTTKHK